MKNFRFLRVGILTLLLIVGVNIAADAQHSISSQRKTQGAKVDTIKFAGVKTLATEANTPAYQRFLKRERWREKNFVETINKLTFNQFGYVNWLNGNNNFNGTISSQSTYVHQAENIVIASYLNASYSLGRNDGVTVKSTDYLRLNNDVGYVIYNKWSYTLGLNLSTQFSKTYVDQELRTTYRSKFFAPATLNPYLGLTYVESSLRKITVSPISGNLLMVLDDSLSNAGAHGVEPGKKLKLTAGALISARWNFDLTKNGMVKYRTTFESFWDYNSPPRLTWDHWIDVTYKMFTFAFHVRALYDEGVTIMKDGPDGTQIASSSHLQIQQDISFGISYTFRNKTKPKFTIVK